MTSFEIAKSSYAFLFKNYKAYFAILLMAIPYLLVIDLMSMALVYWLQENQVLRSVLSTALSIPIAYFTSIVAINWHQAYLTGFPIKERVKPFIKFNSDHLDFIKFIIAIQLISAISGTLKFLPGLLAIIAMIGSFALLYIVLRFSFYFPAKAVGHDITIKKSFEITKGHILKIVFTSILALLPAFIISMFFIAGSYGVVIENITDENYIKNWGDFLSFYLTNLPNAALYYLLFWPIGVSVISELYRQRVEEEV